MINKLLILYSPERTSGKTVYDCIEMRDGELMINSGACSIGSKSKLFFTGGLNSLLPILELINAISLMNKSDNITIHSLLNEYLRLIIQILSANSYMPFECENSNFFTTLFYLISKLPHSAVNS